MLTAPPRSPSLLKIKPLHLLLSVLALFAVGTGALSAQQAATQADLDAKFEAAMKDARLEGQFNVIAPNGQMPAYDELYMVSEMERGEGNTWIFKAKMSYGNQEHPAEFPIPVQVLWAGDTPVITMTDTTVEGLGTFTVRLLLHGDRYAGSWQHGAVGGHMWGRLVKDGAEGGESP